MLLLYFYEYYCWIRILKLLNKISQYDTDAGIILSAHKHSYLTHMHVHTDLPAHSHTCKYLVLFLLVPTAVRPTTTPTYTATEPTQSHNSITHLPQLYLGFSLRLQTSADLVAERGWGLVCWRRPAGVGCRRVGEFRSVFRTVFLRCAFRDVFRESATMQRAVNPPPKSCPSKSPEQSFDHTIVM